MALVTTTISNALSADDQFVTVASATSIAEGRLALIDQEMVKVAKGYTSGDTKFRIIRGVEGTAAVAHPSSADFTHGAAEDFSDSGTSTTVTYPAAGRTRTVTSYSAAGAITLPTQGTDAVAVILGSSVLAMTLAAPDEAITGSFLYVVNDTAAAHTLTVTAGFGDAGSGYTVLTFDGNGTNGVVLMACGAKWILMGQTDGTLTKVATSIA